MDDKEFRAMFNYKVDEAKRKYRSPGGERKKKLDNLKEKIISKVQREFLEAIPEVIPLEKYTISSNWIVIDPSKGYYIADVAFTFECDLECFLRITASELADMLNKAVLVDKKNDGKYLQFRFSVEV